VSQAVEGDLPRDHLELRQIDLLGFSLGGFVRLAD
jgi:hypothetical protein